MRVPLLIALIAVSAGVVGFLVGRDSFRPAPGRTDRGSYDAGFQAGRESAFCCYDGGWGYGEPYIVVLRRGRAGTTYRIAERWPMVAGSEYRPCGRAVCAATGKGAEHVLP
jgi:hypothetical protein